MFDFDLFPGQGLFSPVVLWAFSTLLLPILAAIVLAWWLFYRQWQMNRREERLDEWDAALRAATSVYWSHES